MFAFCFYLPVVRATVILSNSGGTPSNGLFPDVDTRVTLGFTINNAQSGDWTFTVNVGLNGNSSSSLTFNLFTDNGTKPNDGDSPFATSTSYNATLGRYVLTGNGTLSAGQRYWLVASTTGLSLGPFFTWHDQGAYGASTDAARYGWGYDLGDGFGWQISTSTSHPLNVEIDVTPVPEPAQSSAIAVLFLICCSVTHLVRRKRAAAISRR